VEQVRIAPGVRPGVLRQVLSGGSVGTRMVASEVAVR
jgi:hypothetical protein